jgi:hypothetical protein
MVRVSARVFLALSFAAAPVWAPAAEVALLKSGDAPAWQPALDALRRTVGGHALSEFDLRGERSEAERVLASLKGRSSEKSVPEALRSLLSGVDAVDALWIPPDPILLSDQTRRFLLWEMIKSGKPVFSSSAVLLTEGALASNGPDYVSIGEQVGDLVNRLAVGDRPARGTFLVPRGELAINRRIADKLRISIPSEALKAASRVY